MNAVIDCPDCGQSISKSDLKQHILGCKHYKARMLDHTTQLAMDLNEQYLEFLLAEMDLAKDNIKALLRSSARGSFRKRPSVEKTSEQKSQLSARMSLSNGHQLSENPADDFSLSDYLSAKKDRKVQVPSKADSNQQKIIEYVTCQNCAQKLDANQVNKFLYAYNCYHLLCAECARSYIQDQYVESEGRLKCLASECRQLIPTEQIREIVGNSAFEALEKKLLRKIYNFVVCCKCEDQFEFTAGTAKDAPKATENGQLISKTCAEHFANNRFVCRNANCKQQQCRECKSTPYHLGKTCLENFEFQQSTKCRYCREVIPKGFTSQNGIRAFDDICPNKQCQKQAKSACSKMHKCRHACFGYINEKQCLPCLNEKCCKGVVRHDQDEDSYCSICYTEDLKASPCVMSKCGHIFHYRCLQKRLAVRWLTPRILLSFCACPLCKQWISVPEDCPLSVILKKFEELKETLQDKALKRLKYEQNDKDARLTDPKSQFYNKPVDYAMAIYAYFECFKCKKPYFGGRKSCAEAMNAEPNQGPGKEKDFEAEKLICPECCPISVKNCPTHGKQFISFKCKFCCSIAQWFCWGNTHFCDACHTKQIKGEYVSKMAKEKLPICEGPDICPSGGEHGGNGEQYNLGCLLCRNYKSQKKDF